MVIELTVDEYNAVLRALHVAARADAAHIPTYSLVVSKGKSVKQRVWLVAELDWELFRDDLEESVEGLLPDKAFLTPEAAMAAVQEQVEELVGKLRWAIVDDCWVANVGEPDSWPDGASTQAHYFRVYPVEVQG